MIEEIINNITNTCTNSFDFTFCIVVNTLTYIIIKANHNSKNYFNFGLWAKRIVFILVSILVAIVYYFTGSESKVLFNSIIIAPVSWSWIFKPICNKLGIDYSSKNTIFTDDDDKDD